MSKQTVFEGAIVLVQGYEVVATGVEWGEHNGKPCARFTGTYTDNPRNDSLRHTVYNGGRYGGIDYQAP